MSSHLSESIPKLHKQICLSKCRFSYILHRKLSFGSQIKSLDVHFKTRSGRKAKIWIFKFLILIVESKIFTFWSVKKLFIYTWSFLCLLGQKHRFLLCFCIYNMKAMIYKITTLNCMFILILISYSITRMNIAWKAVRMLLTQIKQVCA